MNREIVALVEDISDESLYSEDLAPVPEDERTWSVWNIAAIWVGMAVCIPTYLLASYMIKSGLGWVEALIIILVANVLVTVPMVLNGHAGMKYGAPFPVLGRAAFGTMGVHIPSIVRGIVACGWFGIQTWIGGLAFYAIWCAIMGTEMDQGLSPGKFVGFGLFWLLNIHFIWQGTESIRWLENFAAPILIVIGILLIAWGANGAGGFGKVLEQSRQMSRPAAELIRQDGSLKLSLSPVVDLNGAFKADAFRVSLPGSKNAASQPWRSIAVYGTTIPFGALDGLVDESGNVGKTLDVEFRKGNVVSSKVTAVYNAEKQGVGWSTYIFWLTAMVGFWATMSISIADITRYARSQKEQMVGQFLGLPGTMLLYSFVGVFVTCASLIMFSNVLIVDDAPWDPVTLLANFENPFVVVAAQIFMVIATLSTNIAANVIAPANAFANAMPKRLSFRSGGVITGIIGILICPWWLLDEISNLLIFVSGLLGPVLGVLVCDYFFVRKTRLQLAELYRENGVYAYKSGFNPAALTALLAGVLVALIGYWVPALKWLYTLSWFTGVLVSGLIYYVMMRGKVPNDQAAESGGGSHVTAD